MGGEPTIVENFVIDTIVIMIMIMMMMMMIIIMIIIVFMGCRGLWIEIVPLLSGSCTLLGRVDGHHWSSSIS